MGRARCRSAASSAGRERRDRPRPTTRRSTTMHARRGPRRRRDRRPVLRHRREGRRGGRGAPRPSAPRQRARRGRGRRVAPRPRRASARRLPDRLDGAQGDRPRAAADEPGRVAAGVRLAQLVVASSAPIRSSSSNSSRRCVRIISGPSVAIVNATSCSTKRGTSRGPPPRRAAPSSAGSRWGRSRASRSASRSSAISSGSRAARMPWPIRSGRSDSTTSPISSAPVAPSSPTWIVTPRPASRAVSTIGASCV